MNRLEKIRMFLFIALCDQEIHLRFILTSALLLLPMSAVTSGLLQPRVLDVCLILALVGFVTLMVVKAVSKTRLWQNRHQLPQQPKILSLSMNHVPVVSSAGHKTYNIRIDSGRFSAVIISVVHGTKVYLNQATVFSWPKKLEKGHNEGSGRVLRPGLHYLVLVPNKSGRPVANSLFFLGNFVYLFLMIGHSYTASMITLIVTLGLSVLISNSETKL